MNHLNLLVDTYVLSTACYLPRRSTPHPLRPFTLVQWSLRPLVQRWTSQCAMPGFQPMLRWRQEGFRSAV